MMNLQEATELILILGSSYLYHLQHFRQHRHRQLHQQDHQMHQEIADDFAQGQHEIAWQMNWHALKTLGNQSNVYEYKLEDLRRQVMGYQRRQI